MAKSYLTISFAYIFGLNFSILLLFHYFTTARYLHFRQCIVKMLPS